MRSNIALHLPVWYSLKVRRYDTKSTYGLLPAQSPHNEAHTSKNNWDCFECGSARGHASSRHYPDPVMISEYQMWRIQGSAAGRLLFHSGKLHICCVLFSLFAKKCGTCPPSEADLGSAANATTVYFLRHQMLCAAIFDTYGSIRPE